jgi:hypothetical protein
MTAKTNSETIENEQQTSKLIGLALIGIILELIIYGGTFVGLLLAFMAMLSWLENKRKSED